MAVAVLGGEGFLIMFHSRDVDHPTWWNIGGWNNTSHAIQESVFAESHVNGSVETDRWYDIRVQVTSDSVKAYLDDELIHEAEATEVAFSQPAVPWIRAKSGTMTAAPG